jgi:hypothetical protein
MVAQSRDALLAELKDFVEREQLLDDLHHDLRSIFESRKLRELYREYEHHRSLKSARKRRSKERKRAK